MKGLNKYKGLAEGGGNMCRLLCSLNFSCSQTVNSAFWCKHDIAVDDIARPTLCLTSEEIGPEQFCFQSIYVTQNFSKALTVGLFFCCSQNCTFVLYVFFLRVWYWGINCLFQC